jgi:uncharacterized protein
VQSQNSDSKRPLNEQMKALEHLQEMDLRIDQIKKNRAALPETLKAMDSSMVKAQASVTLKSNELLEIEKTQKQTLAAIDINRDRLTRSMTRLESVQNSQEFGAINKEIDQLKKQSANLDEQLKKSGADTDTVKKVLADLNAQLEKVTGERSTQAEVLSSQGGKLEKDLNSLLSERTQYSSQVDKAILAQYDRVRGARGGLGFVPAIGGRCKGCNMMVPPQLYNEIRKGLQSHSCPSCHRLLFVPVSSAEAAASVSKG